MKCQMHNFVIREWKRIEKYLLWTDRTDPIKIKMTKRKLENIIRRESKISQRGLSRFGLTCTEHVLTAESHIPLQSVHKRSPAPHSTAYRRLPAGRRPSQRCVRFYFHHFHHFLGPCPRPSFWQSKNKKLNR